MSPIYVRVAGLRFYVSALLLVLACAALAVPGRVLAQDRQTVLTDIQLLSEEASQTIFRLKFAPELASVEDIGEAGDAAIRLFDTRRDQGAALNRRLTGFVRSIAFEQATDGVVIRFRTAGPAIADSLVSCGRSRSSKPPMVS